MYPCYMIYMHIYLIIIWKFLAEILLSYSQFNKLTKSIICDSR